jgi:hypothetical protein
MFFYVTSNYYYVFYLYTSHTLFLYFISLHFLLVHISFLYWFCHTLIKPLPSNGSFQSHSLAKAVSAGFTFLPVTIYANIEARGKCMSLFCQF